MNRYKEEFEFCKRIISKAGKILLKTQKEIEIVNQKDDQDIATNADIASERYIVDSILNKYPRHGIFSEELGEINKDSSFKWIIDPLDGTKDYVRGVPLWNCSIALKHEGNTVLSSIFLPYLDVMYSACYKMGSFRNKKQIKVSNTKKLNNSFVYCYLPSYKRQKSLYDVGFKKLSEIGKKVYRLRAHANQNSALCWLAQGGVDAYINLTNKPKEHDILPGLFIAKEAGAYNTVNEIPLIVSNNKDIYEELANIIEI